MPVEKWMENWKRPSNLGNHEGRENVLAPFSCQVFEIRFESFDRENSYLRSWPVIKCLRQLVNSSSTIATFAFRISALVQSTAKASFCLRTRSKASMSRVRGAIIVNLLERWLKIEDSTSSCWNHHFEERKEKQIFTNWRVTLRENQSSELKKLTRAGREICLERG